MDITKETITTSDDNSQQIKQENRSFMSLGYLIYFIFGVLDILLITRFIFKLLGANPSSGFVDFIYNLSAVFVAPFAGIFNTSQATGNVTTSVFEPATIIAIVVYSLVAWGIVALIGIVSGKRQNT